MTTMEKIIMLFLVMVFFAYEKIMEVLVEKI